MMSTIALSACTKTLEANKIEAAIKAELNQQGNFSIKSLSCPKDIKIEPGKIFEYAGELNSDGSFFVAVKQEDAERKVSWEVPNS